MTLKCANCGSALTPSDAPDLESDRNLDCCNCGQSGPPAAADEAALLWVLGAATMDEVDDQIDDQIEPWTIGELYVAESEGGEPRTKTVNLVLNYGGYGIGDELPLPATADAFWTFVGELDDLASRMAEALYEAEECSEEASDAALAAEAALAAARAAAQTGAKAQTGATARSELAKAIGQASEAAANAELAAQRAEALFTETDSIGTYSHSLDARASAVAAAKSALVARTLQEP